MRHIALLLHASLMKKKNKQVYCSGISSSVLFIFFFLRGGGGWGVQIAANLSDLQTNLLILFPMSCRADFWNHT